jgi:hypothetical protein
LHVCLSSLTDVYNLGARLTAIESEFCSWRNSKYRSVNALLGSTIEGIARVCRVFESALPLIPAGLEASNQSV